jgi:hypothetical protein
LIGGQRYPANQGGLIDVESAQYVAQCKEVRVLSLAALEALALAIEREAEIRAKIGLVIVKRRAGRGMRTPKLVILTARQFQAMSGPLPR